MPYILDTDHLSLILRGNQQIKERLTTIPPHEIAITIVTAEEQLRGRLAQLAKSTSGESRSNAYQYLHRAINDLAKLQIIDYDETAHQIYEQLKQQRIRIGSQDLRIAAIALASRSVFVTRNYSDFSKVPGLLIEDWTY
jgi:tRNA(fMet)-specific endonuclease VapC